MLIKCFIIWDKAHAHKFPKGDFEEGLILQSTSFYLSVILRDG